jgi:glycerophosphoryl diester phosphodiesterase
VIVKNGGKTYSQTTENTDKLLLTLDKVLKSAKLKIELVKDIKVISHKEAGLTSQRIVKAIKQALDF